MPAASSISAAATPELVHHLGTLPAPHQILWRARRVAERAWGAPALIGQEEVLGARSGLRARRPGRRVGRRPARFGDHLRRRVRRSGLLRAVRGRAFDPRPPSPPWGRGGSNGRAAPESLRGGQPQVHSTGPRSPATQGRPVALRRCTPGSHTGRPSGRLDMRAHNSRSDRLRGLRTLQQAPDLARSTRRRALWGATVGDSLGLVP